MKPLKIITINANGIRSAHNKSLSQWLSLVDADIICFQETKAQLRILQTDPKFQALFLPDYQHFYHDAEKKGYSGVAIFTKLPITSVKYGLGWATADQEGRYVEITIELTQATSAAAQAISAAAQPQFLKIASLYLPSGSSGDARQQVKFDFLDAYQPILAQQLAEPNSHYILCGDWNIAHRPIDLVNWKANQKCSGFLPEERAWLDQIFANGWVDSFRHLHPELVAYTWWSNRSKTAWERDQGWRIDYQIVSPKLAPTLCSAEVYRGHKFSDHAPVVVTYDLTKLNQGLAFAAG